MNFLKKVLFPLFSIFLLYRSYDMMSGLLTRTKMEFSFSEVLIISFLINLFITGIFAFPGFVYPTNKILGTKYYQYKIPKLTTWLYRRLKVAYFRKLLLFVFWGKQKNKKIYFNGTRGGLDHFIYQSQQSEFGHTAAFISILITTVLLIVKGYFILSLIVSIINIIGNLYPIILQRYHRIRIDKLTSRLQ